MANQFMRGIFEENPTFRLVLGMCPTLAVTSSATNGVGMGLATTVVLLGSNILISLLRKIIPAKIRIPIFIVIIASFVTIVDLCMNAYTPALHKSLGIFIPLIVVNCIILGRAEAYAFKNGMFGSILDALGMGVGFTLSLTLLGSIREILGNGSVFCHSLMGASFQPAIMMVLPPGAFLTLGLLMALMNHISNKNKRSA
jgi:electron transport complex protein RnfE